MQYNSPDTIYFRQACSIQELAKKIFDNLRQDSDDNELDPEPKVVRRGRPPKNLKRPLGRPPLVRANPDFSEASLATAGGTTNRSNSELRKGSSHPQKYGATDSFARSLLSSRNSEAYIGRPPKRFERPDEMIGSSSKGISMKHGKRQIVLDENRRNTYKNSYAFDCRHEPSVLNTFRGERKQLIAICSIELFICLGEKDFLCHNVYGVECSSPSVSSSATLALEHQFDHGAAQVDQRSDLRLEQDDELLSDLLFAQLI